MGSPTSDGFYSGTQDASHTHLPCSSTCLSCYMVKLASSCTAVSCLAMECGYKHVVSLSMFCVTSSKQVPGPMYKSIVTLLKHRYIQEKQAVILVPKIPSESSPNLSISHAYHCHTFPIPSHSNLDLNSMSWRHT